MKIIISLFLILFITGSLLAIFSNYTQAGSAFEEGLKEAAEGTGHAEIAELEKPLSQIIGQVISAFLAFLGVIFLGLMIYGGYIWMMAKGNEQEVDKAKNTIKNSLIGLIIVLAAYAITYFVASKFPVAQDMDCCACYNNEEPFTDGPCAGQCLCY